MTNYKIFSLLIQFIITNNSRFCYFRVFFWTVLTNAVTRNNNFLKFVTSNSKKWSYRFLYISNDEFFRYNHDGFWNLFVWSLIFIREFVIIPATNPVHPYLYYISQYIFLYCRMLNKVHETKSYMCICTLWLYK